MHPCHSHHRYTKTAICQIAPQIFPFPLIKYHIAVTRHKDHGIVKNVGITGLYHGLVGRKIGMKRGVEFMGNIGKDVPVIVPIAAAIIMQTCQLWLGDYKEPSGQQKGRKQHFFSLQYHRREIMKRRFLWQAKSEGL